MYDAFISYSHAADGRLAPALQSGLQRMARPWRKPRALRVFRDVTGLSTNQHLWTSIVTALQDAEWFVLLASPESAQSPWVDRELACWFESKSVDRILPVVTDGDWCWDPHAARLVGDAVPARLAAEVVDEPRYLDLRWARDETDLDLHDSRFRSAVADLAAPIHGVARDELENEDTVQHRRIRRLVGALAVLLVIAVGISLFAESQRNSQQTATAAARQDLLVADSQLQLSSNPRLATLLAIEADRRHPSAATRAAVLNAVVAQPDLRRTFGPPAVAAAPLVGQRVAVESANRGVSPNHDVLQVWDWQTGSRVAWPDAPPGDDSSGVVSLASTADGRLLAVLSGDGMVQLYSGQTLEPEGQPFPSGYRQPLSVSTTTVCCTLGFSPNGQYLAVSAPPNLSTGSPVGVKILSQVGGRWVADPTFVGGLTGATGFAFSSDGSVIATTSPTSTGTDVVVNDLSTGKALATLQVVPSSNISIDWAQRRLVVGTKSGGTADAVWYDLSATSPTPQAINVGTSASAGNAVVGYDPTDSQLGVSTTNGIGIFAAATMTRLPDVPVLPAISVGPLLFPDSAHVIAPATQDAPLSVWDLSGSVLATRTSEDFDGGIFPLGSRTFYGVTSLGHTFSVLGPDYRPLAAPMPAGTTGAVVCTDPDTDRFASVASDGDLVVRQGAPPFRALSTASGVATRLPTPTVCAWSPDGRLIAIGSSPQTGQPGPASVALYDVTRKKLRWVQPLPGATGIASLVFGAGSRSLLIGEVNAGPDGVYRVADVDRKPRVRVAFPGATSIAGDADGRRLVVAYASSVRAFDADTLAPVTRSIALPNSNISFVASSPDGKTAVVDDASRGWRLIDLQAQQPDGPWLPKDSRSNASVGFDDTTVYVKAPGGGGEVWNLAPANLQETACRLAGRNLTEHEWQTYLSWAGPRRATCAQYPLH